MFKFSAPQTDPAELSDAKDLDDLSKLVQAMRGLACNTSFLIVGYHYYYVSACAESKGSTGTTYVDAVRAAYLSEAFRGDVLVRLRRSCDADPNSLAAAAIAKLLKKDTCVSELKAYLAKGRGSVPTLEDDSVDRLVSYIQQSAECLSVKDKAATRNSANISKKVALLRRMANKAVAQITLDDYVLTDQDIRDVFVAVLTLACAIQKLLGELAYPGSFHEVEEAAMQDAVRMFGAPEKYNGFVGLIEKLLPDWIKRY